MINDYNFERLLMNAIKKCDSIHVDDFLKNFSLLYPFTTENISGYIDEFDLDEKSLLTVGSSADQVINAALYRCKDITLLDVSPYTRFYTYLKISTLLEVERNEFLKFLCFKKYKGRKDNKEAFNNATYSKIKTTLRLLDYESYLLWVNYLIASIL